MTNLQQKRYKLLGILLVLNLYSFSYIKGQSNKLYIEVLEEDNKPIELFNGVLLSVEDSSLIMGNVFWNGKLEFATVLPETMLLKVTALGYEGQILTIDFKKPHHIPKRIFLKSSVEVLSEVVVSDVKPIFTQESDKIIVNVSSSILGNTSTNLLELLKQTPRVLVDDDNSVSIFGKGTSIVMLNGRKVANLDIISNLPSSDIEKIEVITSPSAEYDASGKGGVINVVTKSLSIEGTSGQVQAMLTQGNHLRGLLGADWSIKKKEYDLRLAYTATPYKTSTLERYYRYPKEGDTDLILKEVTQEKEYLNNHQFQSNLGVNTGKKSRVEFNYIGYTIGDTQSIYNHTTVEGQQSESSIDTQTESDVRFYQNTLNTNFTSELSDRKDKLSIHFDYTQFRNKKSDYIFEETGTSESLAEQANKENYNENMIDLYAAQLDYVLPIHEGEFKAGIKSYFSKNKSEVLFKNSDVIDPNISNKFEYEENIHSAYLQLEKKINQWNFKAGMRVEATDQQGYSYNESAYVIDSSYVNFFPSASVSYDHSKNLQLSAAYSRRINRPKYQYMNPYLNYLDSLSYFVGNSYLLPEITDGFDFTITYMKYASLNIGYSESSNFMGNYVIQDGNITYATVSNIDKSNIFSISLNLPYELGIWRTYNSIGWRDQHFEFRDNSEELLNLSSPLWYIYAYNSFKLPLGFKIDFTYQYTSPGVQGIFEFDHKHVFNIGMSKSFLEDKLNTYLTINDVFNSNRFNSYTNLNDVEITHEPYYDRQFIRIGFKYKFGKMATGLKAKKANNEQIKRIITDN